MILPILLLAAAAAAAPAPATDAARTVSLRTKDGWTLAAAYRPPRKEGTVLILAHGVGASKSEWAGLAERLAARGIGTLALDLRGHAGSRKGPDGERGYESFDADVEWQRAAGDFDAAAAWLKARGIKEERIALGGASVGANLAALAASTRPKTPFLLLLSPGAGYRGVRLARPETRTLVGASRGDRYAYASLKDLAVETNVEAFEAPSGHGVQMFEDPVTLDKVVAWVASESAPRTKAAP